MAMRLKAGAPLILACNHYACESQPLILAAWGERWRMEGTGAEEVKAKLGKILQGADPPHSEAEVISLLDGAGFGQPIRFLQACSGERGWFAGYSGAARPRPLMLRRQLERTPMFCGSAPLSADPKWRQVNLPASEPLSDMSKLA
jgi:hypothetical protein